jgi:hypothetical protein
LHAANVYLLFGIDDGKKHNKAKPVEKAKKEIIAKG